MMLFRIMALINTSLTWTLMNFFIQLNSKEDVLKNIGNQTGGPHWYP